MKVLIYSDGGARGNPGPSAFAAILTNEEGKTIRSISKYIGTATNNEAEYRGLLAGLDEAIKLQADEVEIIMDSELVVRQINGQYAVKAPNLIPLANEVRERLRKFKCAKICHAKREHPMIVRADALVNEELDIMKLAQSLRKN